MKVTNRLFLLIFAISVAFVSCKPKDADIKTAIEQAIAAIPDASNAVIAVKDGVATITGEFKDDATKAAVETAAKAVKGVKSVVNNGTVTPPPPPPVTISADDTLIKGVNDAVKDFTTVKADVKDGVVTLTGEIKKASLPKLMQSLMALKPKKVDNKLTVK
ncbi:MAG TPA: BON domain-containing protein [Chitinophagales bacterium]|nr:BON domain-containing protein [Chitinophagales bacterium]HNM32059.1 BON domain-containing protein [Chitinophagales bacterium]